MCVTRRQPSDFQDSPRFSAPVLRLEPFFYIYAQHTFSLTFWSKFLRACDRVIWFADRCARLIKRNWKFDYCGWRRSAQTEKRETRAGCIYLHVHINAHAGNHLPPNKSCSCVSWSKSCKLDEGSGRYQTMGTKFTMVGRRTSLCAPAAAVRTKKYSTTAPKGKSTSRTQVQCQYLARFCRNTKFLAAQGRAVHCGIKSHNMFMGQ